MLWPPTSMTRIKSSVDVAAKPAEKKGVSPSEALSPDQTPSVAPYASSLSMFSFRYATISAVDGKAGSGDEARFFRREVRGRSWRPPIRHPFVSKESAA